MPSKSLLAYAETHKDPDFSKAFQWLRQVRADIAPHDSVQRYTDAGLTCFWATLHLTKTVMFVLMMFLKAAASGAARCGAAADSWVAGERPAY